MHSYSRRTFLTQSSTALAGLGLGIRRMPGTYTFMQALPMQSRQPVAKFFPEMVEPDHLRELAQAAVDAAIHAGADYADIRVSDVRKMTYGLVWENVVGGNLYLGMAYGVRVRCGGAWSFAFGADLTTDEITRTARSATSAARGLANVLSEPFPMARVPVVREEWTLPVQIDPFSVPPDDHAQLILAYSNAGSRVPDGQFLNASFRWTGETRVFASSEGSLITQRLTNVIPTVGVRGTRAWMMRGVALPVPGFQPRSAGFEIMLGEAHYDRIRAATEDAVRLSRYVRGTADVGRFPVAMDGLSVGTIIRSSLVPAFELARVLGYDADGEGTSYLGPVGDVHGQQVFSTQLSMSTNPTPPHYSARRWDDEGVATSAFPLIDRGRVVNYFATRATAGALAPIAAKTGTPIPLHGSAVSGSAHHVPNGRGVELTVSPGDDGVTIDSMISQINNGLLVCGFDGRAMSDQGLISGYMAPNSHALFEVKHGKIIRRLEGGALQFNTKKLFSNLIAAGNARTMQTHAINTGVSAGPVPMGWDMVVTTPAMYFKEIDLVSNIGKIR